MAINQIIIASVALAIVTIGMFYLANDEIEPGNHMQRFTVHQQRFNKRYTSKDEMKFRFGVYKKNLDRIDKHNKQASSFKMGENAFTDLTFEEFKRGYLSSTPIKNSVTFDSVPNLECGNVDWRRKNAVSRVKDQGNCGSCWAFATTGSLESAYTIFKNQNLELSEQELVDCSQEEGNYGCNGGYMSLGFDYILKKNISLEENYAYTGKNGTCQTSQGTKYSVAGYKKIDPVDVNGLMSAVTIQPTTALIEIRDDFIHYSSGIYTNNDSGCGGSLNHAVLVVGFFVDTVGSYFIVKNSWSDKWGEDGYIRIKIGRGSGICGLANENDVYPSL